MKNTISKSLWAIALATLAATACNSNEAEQTAGTEPRTEPAAVTPEVAEERRLEATSSDQAAIVTPSPEPIAKSEAPAGTMAATGASAGLSNRQFKAKPAKKGRGQHAMKDMKEMPSRPMSIAGPVPPPPPGDSATQGSEDYKDYGKNPMVSPLEDRLSTFAVDVDTASYAIARRKLLEGHLPPQSSVRVEEFVNYFKYDFAAPADAKKPFAVHMDMAPSPFAKERKLLRVGVQAKKLSLRERKNANLVFLVDVSGSMQSPDKLELAKRAMRVLVDNLKDGDTVSLVTYAGSTRVVLEPTGLEKKGEIISALEELRAGGSTAMSSGMELAYGLAAKALSPDSLSRVIVLSDGDANIGNTNHESMLKTIAGKVKEGVTLSTIGFGMGNYKDTLMEQLANKGNGNYFYIDGMSQARRVFQEQLGGTLEVVAKDVKIQVDFDPKVVKRYRLVGYENRDVADNDFRNDKVDAGEIGAGHTVTAMYEVELIRDDAPPATVRLRAKKPKGSKSSETAYAFQQDKSYKSFEAAPADFRFASAVMGAAEILRGSEHATEWSLREVVQIAKGASDAHPTERSEFVSLVERAAELKGKLARR